MERIGLEPGAQIGGYTVVAPLGSGGMGTVYRAVDDGGTAVALKLLHPQVGADAAARERLRREVVALQRLRHPAVASVLDAEADSTEAFIVTELVHGDTLAEHVRDRGELAPADLAELAAGLADALEAVHAAGVVHRDLKPSNVLVTDDGPVLIDFGIAQAADDEAVTSTGFVVGTPGYLAPELLDGADPTAATDMWGWAALVAFAATGRAPFGTRPLEAVLARARSGEPDLAGLGPLTAGALRRALDPDPATRLAPADLVAALRVAALDGDPLDGDDSDDASDDAPDEVDDDAAPAETVAIAAGGAATTVAAVSAHDGRTAVMPVDGPDETELLPEPVPGEPDEADGPDETAVLPADDLDAELTALVAEPLGEPDGDLDVDLDDLDDETGVEWIEEDLDASELTDEGSGYQRPPARRRWGSMLALAGVVGVAGALAPLVTLIVVGVVIVAVRTFGTAVEAMHGRRERSGVRPSDVWRTVVASPWYFVRAVVAQVPSLVVSACVMLVVGGAIVWLVDNETWTIGELESGDPIQGTTAAVVVGALVLLGVCVVWWGPLSGMTRTGARRVLAIVAPGRTGALVLVCVCLAAMFVIVAVIANGAPIVWAPVSTPTVP
ncbi:serine/threonine-protein kinase [Cellulomonas composti]|uniref:Protein kinase domain-containing protein n=1 Tax=Cellulomonas composti TaxID=266130 RepID=A0A511JD03_9CELL|nr:serine/threonine-protein kinase [Cellulomonas composti]GEL95881.1 hypothetical protein CCO02nite_25390 [Cellulomonas composti]